LVDQPKIERAAKHGQTHRASLTNCLHKGALAECLPNDADRDFLALFNQALLAHSADFSPRLFPLALKIA
jgi:hypothetical protein